MLRLLRLHPNVLESLVALDDPLPSRIICEKTLRPLVNLPAHEQEVGIRMLERLPLLGKSSE